MHWYSERNHQGFEISVIEAGEEMQIGDLMLNRVSSTEPGPAQSWPPASVVIVPSLDYHGKQ
jgi:hypothetical protein